MHSQIINTGLITGHYRTLPVLIRTYKFYLITTCIPWMETQEPHAKAQVHQEHHIHQYIG